MSGVSRQAMASCLCPAPHLSNKNIVQLAYSYSLFGDTGFTASLFLHSSAPKLYFWFAHVKYVQYKFSWQKGKSEVVYIMRHDVWVDYRFYDP